VTIASLYVNLEANTASYIENMEKAARHTELIGRRITRAGIEITKVFAPLAALYAGALTAAVKQSEIVHGQLAQQWDRLVLSGRLLLREIGGALTPAFQEMIRSKEALIERVRQLVAWFEQLSPSTQALIVKVGLFLAVLGPTVLVIGEVIRAAGALWSVFSQLASLIASVVAPVLAFLVSPAGLITLAIVALIGALALLIHHWDLVKDGASVAWNAIKIVVFDAIDKILGALEKLFIASGWDSMVDKIEAVRDHLGILRLEAQRGEEAAKKLWSAYHTPLLPEWLTSLPGRLKSMFTLPSVSALPTLPFLQAQDALAKLQTQLHQNAAASQLFGSSFNRAAADAAAYKSTIEELIKNGVSLDAVLDRNGTTLRTLAAAFQQVDTQAQVALGPHLAQLIQGFATAFGDVISGATKSLRGFGGALLGVIGGFMQSLGAALISVGAAKLAALTLNPFAAIAVGGALVAFGRALSNTSAAIAGVGSSGGGGGTAAAASAPAPTSASEPQPAANIVLELRGDGLVTTLFRDSRNQDALAQALQDITGRQIIVTPVTA
jgi:hypothetical protein